MIRAVGIIVLLAVTGCREKPPPRAVAVREDGALELSLCSFNVRYENDGDHGWRAWPNRIDRVVRTIRQLDPDVLGIQEALHGQAADLRASLPDYAFHGVGRDDGDRAGEYAAIFYKADRFEPGEKGTFWLSDFPEQPGSRTWGNSVVRCTTWIRLIDRATGRGFYVYNTHWDHRHQPSREKSARLIAERLADRRHADEPVVLLGDFNATEGNPALEHLVGRHTGLVDPYRILHQGEKNRRTLHFWDGDIDGWAKVDHILVSSSATLEAAGIHHAATRKEQPSDHYPAWVRITWPPP